MSVSKSAINATVDKKYVSVKSNWSGVGEIVTFTVQNDAIEKVGKVGCDTSDVMRWTLSVYKQLQAILPCKQNEITIKHLEEAIAAQEARTAERTEAGVEGTYEKVDKETEKVDKGVDTDTDTDTDTEEADTEKAYFEGEDTDEFK